MQKICFFIGHRDAPESIMPDLLETLDCYISEHGVSVFVVGGYGEFDRIATKAVQQKKKKYPDISLLRLRPYSITQAPVRVPKGYDGIFRPPGMEKCSNVAAIPRANYFMIDHADCLIAYVRNQAGNSFRFLEHAQKREAQGWLLIENLADSLI